MITVDDILTSSGKFPYRPEKWPPSEQMLSDAATLAFRVNELLTAFNQSRHVSSGYRPPEVNAATPGAARHSNHTICRAADLIDKDGSLDAWCSNHLGVLEAIGLWLEHPDSTPGWCHVQIVPPGSGDRVFYP